MGPDFTLGPVALSMSVVGLKKRVDGSCELYPFFIYFWCCYNFAKLLMRQSPI